ncbi:MAG TPA: hypothetical protein VMT46_18925 [Anaerolineaceae bacterium]|nr:hypothetical protein [Anaerolineaceae bacterium]
MFPLSVNDFFLTMATGLFLIGLICVISGIILLVVRAAGHDVHTLAEQTTKLAQKGIADDISGLVGNASALINATNQLVKTTAGIGIFLIMIGLVMMGAAYLLVAQIR